MSFLLNFGALSPTPTENSRNRLRVTDLVRIEYMYERLLAPFLRLFSLSELNGNGHSCFLIELNSRKTGATETFILYLH